MFFPQNFFFPIFFPNFFFKFFPQNFFSKIFSPNFFSQNFFSKFFFLNFFLTIFFPKFFFQLLSKFFFWGLYSRASPFTETKRTLCICVMKNQESRERLETSTLPTVPTLVRQRCTWVAPRLPAALIRDTTSLYAGVWNPEI